MRTREFLSLGRVLTLGGILAGAVLFCSCQDKKQKNTPVPSVPSSSLSSPDESLVGFSGKNAFYHTESLVKMGPRPSGSAGYESMLSYMEKYLAAQGWKTERQSFESDTPVGKRRFTNLRARFGEKTDFSSPIKGLVGCHIDTKVFEFPFVGANDGASHAGVLLEIARLASRDPDLFDGVEMVFFDGEEAFGLHMDGLTDGLFGSSHYVKNLPKLPLWMVNVDMVGAKNLKIRIPVDTPQSLYALYRETIRQRNESEDVFGVSEGTVLDDHLPFQEKGVPAINLIGDFQEGSWWHTPGDTLDIIGERSLERSGLFLQNLLKNIRAAESGNE